MLGGENWQRRMVAEGIWSNDHLMSHQLANELLSLRDTNTVFMREYKRKFKPINHTLTSLKTFNLN
jgi:hypothetical protein